MNHNPLLFTISFDSCFHGAGPGYHTQTFSEHFRRVKRLASALWKRGHFRRTSRKPGLICCRCTFRCPKTEVCLAHVKNTIAVTMEMQSAKVVVWPFWLLGPPGIKLEDRVGTLMWNSAWHMECPWAKIVQVLACFAPHMFRKVWV